MHETTQVGLFTNNAPILRAAFPRWFPELERLFDPIVFSYQLGATKPAAACFRKVEALTGLEPGRLMLIDDSIKNIDAAADCGWHAVRFLGSPELRSILRELSVL